MAINGTAGRGSTGEILSYRDMGTAEDPAVLYFHGLGSSAAVVPPLAGLRVLAVNRPGVGASTARPYSMSSFSDEISNLMAELGMDAAHVVGYSAGGLHAEVFSRRHPERSLSLTRISSASPFFTDAGPVDMPEDWARVRKLVTKHPRSTRLYFAAQSVSARKPARALDRSLASACADDQRVAADPQVRELLIKATREGYANRGLGVFHDAQALMEPVTGGPRDPAHPVRLWHGEEDSVFPPSVLDANRALYHDADVRLLPGRGHLAAFELWGEIRAELLQA